MSPNGNAVGASAPQNIVKLRPIHSHPAFRIAVLGALVTFVAAALFIDRFLSQNRSNRWLPERPGEAVVVEKLSGGGRADDLRLHVLVHVPAASPEEAGLLPQDFPGRAEALAPRELFYDVPTPERDWAEVEPGDRIRASYQINIARSKIVVRALYLDHLQQ